MLFLWTATKLGKIWIDGDAAKLIISKRLPREFYVQDVSFLGEKNLLNAYIAVSEDVPAEKKQALEARIGELFERSGITAQINWLNVAPQDNKKTNPLWTMPLFWAAAAAAATALFHMGIRGIVWSVFSAVAAYGAAWVLVTEDGHRQIAALKEHFRR
ncbi:MAG: hypothetical protein IKT09_02920 [Synergistes sp.]|nr:hypothetical protein [Synergistes sp.]